MCPCIPRILKKIEVVSFFLFCFSDRNAYDVTLFFFKCVLHSFEISMKFCVDWYTIWCILKMVKKIATSKLVLTSDTNWVTFWHLLMTWRQIKQTSDKNWRQIIIIILYTGENGRLTRSVTDAVLHSALTNPLYALFSFKSRFQRRKKQTLELKWDQMGARQRWDKKNK